MLIRRIVGFLSHVLSKFLPHTNAVCFAAILILFSFSVPSAIAEKATTPERPPAKQPASPEAHRSTTDEADWAGRPQRNSSRRIVRVGLYENKPKIFTDETGAASGVFAEIIDEIARKEGWQLKYVPCEWAACLEALDKHDIQLMPDVALSPERDERFDFHSETVVNSWSVVYANKKNAIRRLSDLRGRRIAVLKESIQNSILGSMANGFGFDVSFIEAGSFEEAFSFARSGRADAAVSNYLFGDYYCRQYGLDKTAVVFNPVSLYFATASGTNPDLLAAIDAALVSMKSEPGSVYYRALGRWMEPPEMAVIPPMMIWMLGGIAGLLLLSWAFVWLLRKKAGAVTRNLAYSNKMLHESEKTFRDLFHKHAAVKLLIDPDSGNIVEANEAAENFYGWPRARLRQMRIQDINTLPPGQVKAEMQKASNLERTQFEFRHRIADGSVRDVAVFSSRINTKDGLLLHSIIHDITEQRQAEDARRAAEQALRDSEMKYRTLFETAGDAIMLMRDGKFIDCNNVTLAIFGCTRLQFIGAAPSHFSPPVQPDGRSSEEKAAEMIHQAMTTGTKRFEWTHCREDRTPFPTEVSLNRLELNGETILQAIVRDISERKREETERERLQSHIIQAQKMESVGRLAGGVAHDYNNILSIIMGYTELALEKLAPQDPLCSNLKEIKNAAERSKRITKQLLAYARKEPIAPEVISLNASIEDMLSMLRRLIGEDIDLAWIPGESRWPVFMDPSQLDQILANLCVNARDAISNVGRIVIETGSATFDDKYCSEHQGFMPGDYAVLSVSDNGCGMDEDTLDKIFEPFYTNKGVGQGTGLGLATVYGIVRQNNGFINVYSEPSHGTTFRIYLPRHEGEVKESERRDVSETPLGNGETILVVEDEVAILALIERTLSRLNYSIILAGSPSEALQMVKTTPMKISLLITDVIMPGMNGNQLAEEMRTFLPTIKCLFMSGYTADVIAHRGVLDSGLNFIQKPFSSKDLAIKVRDTLKGS